MERVYSSKPAYKKEINNTCTSNIHFRFDILNHDSKTVNRSSSITR